MKYGRVQGIDRSFPAAAELGKFPRLELSTAVPQQDEWPCRAICVLLVSVIAGVDNECLVHHGSVALRHGFEGFHEFHQHAAVVVADFMPDGISFLPHVP